MDKDTRALLLEIRESVSHQTATTLLERISDDLSETKERMATIEGTVKVLEKRLCSDAVPCQDREMVSKVNSLSTTVGHQNWLIRAIVAVTLIASVGSGFGVIQSCQASASAQQEVEQVDR
jgi:hypothetical protein